MKHLHLLSLLCLIFLILSCEKKSFCEINYDCLKETDENGVSLATCNDIDQWQTNYTPNSVEKYFFSEKEEISLTGVTDSELTNLIFYPNPLMGIGIMSFQISEPSVIHLAVVNEDCNVEEGMVYEVSQPAGSTVFQIDLSEIPKGNYRVYYSLSKEGEHHYTGGFGNIKSE